jgi:hypothetical protein
MVVEPLSASAVVALGWFGNKILGPSADELGSRLRIYTSRRLDKVFGKAEAIAKAENADLKALPPAFAVKFWQNASMSEDDDIITDMWANLLVRAAVDFDVRHNLYASILAEISSTDARTLDGLVDQNIYNRLPFEHPGNIKTGLRFLIFSGRDVPSDSAEAAGRTIVELSNAKWPYAARVYNVSWPYFLDKPHRAGQSAAGGSGRTLSLDVLMRQGLLELIEFQQSQDMHTAIVQALLVTSLGVQFVLTCRGVKPEGSMSGNVIEASGTT